MNGNNPAESTSVAKHPYPVEKFVEVGVHKPAGETTYLLKTSGMQKLGKPELSMRVPAKLWIPTACRVLNDTARYLVEKDRKDVKTGQRVQFNPWTVVEFKVQPDSTIELVEGAPAT